MIGISFNRKGGWDAKGCNYVRFTWFHEWTPFVWITPYWR